ncbi:hypothetical protein V8E36_000822 [Tilletia maclaganii]
MVWVLQILGSLGSVARPGWLVFNRELLSSLAGSASFSVWLLAQTPQIYENYVRGSVAGLSPFFLIQWMFGDLTNLIGAVLTHQLLFQIALAAYFCFIDTVLLSQFWYYSRKESTDGPDAFSIEETERLLEEQVSPPSLTGSLTRSGTGYDAASIISSSTRSPRWAYHSMRQGSTRRDRSESKHGSRSQSLVGKRRQRMASSTTIRTMDSSLHSHFPSQEDLYASRGSGGGGGHHHQPSAATPLMTASTSAGGRSATYRALSQAAWSVAQLADEAAERRTWSREPSRASGVGSLEGSRSRPAHAIVRARSERNVGSPVMGMEAGGARASSRPRSGKRQAATRATSVREMFSHGLHDAPEEGGQGDDGARGRQHDARRLGRGAAEEHLTRESSAATERRRPISAKSASSSGGEVGEGSSHGSSSGGGSAKIQANRGESVTDLLQFPSSEEADGDASVLSSPAHSHPSPASRRDSDAARAGQMAGSLNSLRSAQSASSSGSSSRFGYGFPSGSVPDLTAGAVPGESGATIRARPAGQEGHRDSGRLGVGHSAQRASDGDGANEDYFQREHRPVLKGRRTASRPSRPRTRTGHTTGTVDASHRPLSASQTRSAGLQQSGGSVGAGSTRSPTAARTGAGMVLLSVGLLFAVGRAPQGGLQPGRGDALLSRGRVGNSGLARTTLPRQATWDHTTAGDHGGKAQLQSDSLSDVISMKTLPATELQEQTGQLSFEWEAVAQEPRRSSKHEKDPGRPMPPGAPEPPPKEKINWEQLIGRTSAWTCTVLYLTSRLPQIWTNHVRKSVEGLSMLLFIAAFLGNLFYTISLLASPQAGDWWTLLVRRQFDSMMSRSLEARGSSSSSSEKGRGGPGLTPENKTYLRESLPFLLGSLGASFFDITILIQARCYKNN